MRRGPPKLFFIIYSFFIQTKNAPSLAGRRIWFNRAGWLQGADANGAAGGNDAGKQAHHHGKTDGGQHQPERNDGHDGSAADQKKGTRRKAAEVK